MMAILLVVVGWLGVQEKDYRFNSITFHELSLRIPWSFQFSLSRSCGNCLLFFLPNLFIRRQPL